MISFAVQKLFSLMQSRLFIISLRCWAFWVLFRISFSILTCSSVLPTAYWSYFTVSGLILRSLIHFKSILIQDERQGSSFSLLHVDINFPSNICWRDCLFCIMCFGLLCQRSVGYRCLGLCLHLLFWSIGLPFSFCANTILFLLLWLCRTVWSWVLWCL
jgi:hypothetical protein